VNAADAYYFDTPQPYAPIAAAQEALAHARYEDRIRDGVLFLEHQPVITLGRRGRTQHLLAAPATLEERGIALHTASRGGDVTYHAPGQCVVYPILKLASLKGSAHTYLHQLEEIAIRSSADFGVDAFRVAGKSGAWTSAGKIAAIGFHIRRGVTLHGMSFNAHPDLAGFQLIVPCGLHGDPICSLRSILGASAPAWATVRDALARHTQEVLGLRFDPHHLAGPEALNLPVCG
jgi:lipoate-protein ligase B